MPLRLREEIQTLLRSRVNLGQSRRGIQGPLTSKPMPHRVNVRPFSAYLYRFHNLVERFFNKLKHFQAVATRYEKHDANYLALVKTRRHSNMVPHYELVT